MRDAGQSLRGMLIKAGVTPDEPVRELLARKIYVSRETAIVAKLVGKIAKTIDGSPAEDQKRDAHESGNRALEELLISLGHDIEADLIDKKRVEKRAMNILQEITKYPDLFQCTGKVQKISVPPDGNCGITVVLKCLNWMMYNGSHKITTSVIQEQRGVLGLELERDPELTYSKLHLETNLDA